MKKTIVIALLSALLVGCGSTTGVKGTGEFFSLSNRNVVYRDLTRPVSVDNEPETANYAIVPAPSK